MPWLFPGKHKKERKSQTYEVRIRDPKSGVGVEGGGKTIPCIIDRRPDDVCYFMDQNNTKHYLFGLTGRKFKKERMIKNIVRGCFQREDRAFIKRAYLSFGKNIEKGDKGRVEALKDYLLKGDVDQIILAEKMMYTAVPDDIILNSKGLVPVLVRKTDSGRIVSLSGEIEEVRRI